MARNYDGTNDEIGFGSDASIDDLNPLMVLMWCSCADATDILVNKFTVTTGWQIRSSGTTRVMNFRAGAATTPGNWSATTAFTAGTAFHFALNYDDSSGTNKPSFWINQSSQALSVDTAPVGAIGADAANNLLTGQDAGGGGDFAGRIQNLVIVSGTLSTDQINRHYWWGRIGGACAVIHPFFTDKLNNEGTATANGTATGTTVTSLPRVQRPCTATMGCGVGW